MSSPTAQGATPLSSGGGAWTLRSQEGRLYLFNNQEKKEKDGEKNEQVTAGGVELSRLLAEKNGESCAVYYHHFPLPTAPMGLYCEVDNPHMVPVTPSTVDKYKLCKKPLGDDSGWILHLDAVFLVLQEDPPNDPIINAVEEEDLVGLLKELGKGGESFPNTTYNPVVHIKVEEGKPGNNIAIYFDGKVYRYYVHVNDDTKELVAVRSQYSSNPDDWLNHLQFTLNPKSQGVAQPKATQHDSPCTHGDGGTGVDSKEGCTMMSAQ